MSPPQDLNREAIPAFLRILDHSIALSDVLAHARQAGLPVIVANGFAEEFAAVDLSLHVAVVPDGSIPPSGVDYAGMTPGQRRAFLAWAAQPDTPAPPTFRRLLVANLEVHLLEAPEARQRAAAYLLHLATAPAWRGDPWLQHAILLAFWLQQRGDQLALWLRESEIAPGLLGVALGHQAMLATPLDAHALGVALQRWGLLAALPDLDLLKMRLSSLTTALGQEPLAHALAVLDPEALAPRPWRTAHRGLRLAIPQPDVRPVLEGPLRDMLSMPLDMTDAPAADEDAASEKDDAAQPGWNLILEFGHSRSEFFEPVLNQCRRLPGYTQILDEDRRMIYRVTFRKSEMRRFWRIWDYAQSWASTRVYVNGQELEPWKVWPYSQYLR